MELCVHWLAVFSGSILPTSLELAGTPTAWSGQEPELLRLEAVEQSETNHIRHAKKFTNSVNSVTNKYKPQSYQNF